MARRTAGAGSVNEFRYDAEYDHELGTEVVLGRNVLNRLRLLLDGPATLTRILA